MEEPKLVVASAADGDRGLVLGFGVHENKVVAVGGQGHDLLLWSTDGGATFVEGSSPGPGLRAAWIDSEGMWVCGEYGYISRSLDDGRTWERAKSATKSACLFGLVRGEDGGLWCGGDGGYLSRSTDGLTFKPIKGVPVSIARMSVSPLGVLVPTDTPGNVYVVNGKKVAKTKLEAKTDLMQATVTPKGTLLAVGSKGVILRSEDSGKTFKKIPSPTNVMLAGIDWLADGRVVVVGENGVILISEDDGKTFSQMKQFLAAGTLWCIKRSRGAILIGGEDGVVLALGEMQPLTTVATAAAPVVKEPPPKPKEPHWAAAPPSTHRQEWTPPPPAPLEIKNGIFVTPEMRSMLFPRRGGFAVPIRPLPTVAEAWSELRSAMWAADRVYMMKKSARSGIWDLVTSHNRDRRSMGERLLDPEPRKGSFDDDAALVSLTFERYTTFIVDHHDIIWDALADFLVASVGLSDAIRRMMVGLDDELPYTDDGPFGRLRDHIALTDAAGYEDARRAVKESLEAEAPKAKQKRDDDRLADLHWASTFLLPLGPEAGDIERTIHDAALQFTGEFGNADVRPCGLAAGDRATLELFLEKNRRVRHEFYAPRERMFVASILELCGSECADLIADMKPSEPFDDDVHYNSCWCKLLAHIDDDRAREALFTERSKKGVMWATAAILLSARSNPDAIRKMAEKKKDKEILELLEKDALPPPPPHAPRPDLRAAGEPVPYEPPPRMDGSILKTKTSLTTEVTWRDVEREIAAQQSVYDEGVTWDGVPAGKLTGEALEAFITHRERWMLPTSIEDLALAPISIHDRLLRHGFHVHHYWARWGLLAIMLRGGEKNLPILLAALDNSESLENALVAAGPFGDVSIVPPVATAFAGKKNKAAARSWMLRHPKHAAAGAVAMIAARADDDAPKRVLRYLDGRGHRDTIVSAARAESVEKIVIEILESDPLAAPKVKPPVIPKYAKASELPALKTKDGSKAAAKDVDRLLLELAFSNADEIHPGVIAAKAKYTPESRADFAWSLFETWLAASADPKHAFCMQTVGYFGDDACARKLAALAKAWPGENASARAQSALDALVNIGTDSALMNINLLAEKSKFPAFKAAAKERIEAIADARGLSSDELADRLAPTLGLDEKGSRTLSFGKRTFTVEFNEALAPVVRDGDGKLLADLPKPGKTDDAAKAKDAKAKLSALKKDAKVSASLQISRLEKAMRSERTITRDVFLECFVQHPWMIFLARRLVWGAHDERGKLLGTFRVAEDGTLADAKDEKVDPPARVSVLHPVRFRDGEREAWGQVFADYEILQPFLQIARPIAAPTAEEAASNQLERFQGKGTTYGALRGLEARGWERWYDSVVSGMVRRLSVEHWVQLHFEPGWHPTEDASEIGPQTLDCVRLSSELKLGELSPVVFSEIVYDLERVVVNTG